ncbi:MAG: WecB/TagA/CpsF family glycosyltransferase [Pseudomonadota bacterium]
MSDETQGLFAVSLASEDEARVASATRDIFGIDVRVSDKAETIDFIRRRIMARQHTKFSFVNAHTANLGWSNASFRNTLKRFEVLADGVGVDIGSKLLHGAPFPDNLNGTDFIPALLDGIETPLKVALFGAKPGVADEACRKLAANFPQHEFVVLGHGYLSAEQSRGVLATLDPVKPDILLVAMGNPMQEQWIADHCSADNCVTAFGVGALFDFIAGRVTRAPEWVRRFRLEWIYRLCLEPGRLWRRYILGNPRFLLRVLMQKFGVRPK